jgi:hypothetical protein
MTPALLVPAHAGHRALSLLFPAPALIMAAVLWWDGYQERRGKRTPHYDEMDVRTLDEIRHGKRQLSTLPSGGEPRSAHKTTSADEPDRVRLTWTTRQR